MGYCHTHTHNRTQREGDSWHPKSEDKLFNSNTRHVMLVVGEKGGGGKSTQRTLFYFLNLNTHHIVLTPSLCRNPTGENLLCQCTAQVSLYRITCSTLYFPVNTHPLKTLFHNLSLLHIWIVLLQSYSLWLSNILQDQMERDGEMNGQVGGRGDKRRVKGNGTI